MRLSIKSKDPHMLLEKIQHFLHSNSNFGWHMVTNKDGLAEFTPKDGMFQDKTSMYFYLRPLGNKVYLRGEFTKNSTDPFLNNSILGMLIGTLLNNFRSDITRLSVLK